MFHLGFKIVLAFASLPSNREYLIVTNRLNGLVSWLGWMLGKEEKRTVPTRCFYSAQTQCIKLINALLLHKSKGTSYVH